MNKIFYLAIILGSFQNLFCAAARLSELSAKDLDSVERSETEEEIRLSSRLQNGNWIFCTKYLTGSEKNKIICFLDEVNEIGDPVKTIKVHEKYYKILLQKFLEDENKKFRERRDSVDKKEEKKGR